ncbi:hypothetical protein Efla_003179 [Eimeria flavescens]
MGLSLGALSFLLIAEVIASHEPHAPGVVPEGLSIGPSQVLLPWMPPSYTAQLPAVRTQLQLEGSAVGAGSDGICFYWAIQNPQVVSLLNPDCSAFQSAASCVIDGNSTQGWAAANGGSPCFSRVLVEAVPQPVARRARSWISASEEKAFDSDMQDAAASDGQQQHYSRRAFRSQVLVAPIVRLSFSTRDKRLAIGQLGDVSLLAYDAEGNVFSSLEGLPFYWEVHGEGKIVDVEPVGADAVAGTPARRLVEERGAKEGHHGGPRWRSDAIVLRGRSTGIATITARLAIAEYADVPPASVDFLVHELVALTPSLLLVPPAAVFYFRLVRLWEDGHQEVVSLPSRSYAWSAGDVSVFSSARGTALLMEGEDARLPSLLLTVSDDGVATARGLQRIEHGEDILTGKAVVICQDTRIEERQQADVLVVLPTALRLLYESTEVLPSQPLWRVASAAAAGSISSKDAATTKALLLRQLLLAEEPLHAGGQGRQQHLSSLPALRLLSLPEGQRSGGGPSSTGEGVLCLVQGQEYLFRAELLASPAEAVLPAGRLPGSEERETKVLLPSNAVLHWACDLTASGASEEAPAACPLEKSVTSQQAYALFYARSLGDALLRVSLMQVGSSPGEVWRSDPPLTASLPIRVVTPVFFRLLPRHVNPQTPVGLNQQAGPRQLTAPLLLAPNTSFQLEPEGGSGEYVLAAADPSICSVTSTPSRTHGRFSSSGLVSVNTATRDLQTVFTLQAHAPGVTTLALRDRRQTANALLLFVVVARPAAIELRVDALLLPVSRQAKAAARRQQAVPSFEDEEATAVSVAYADLYEFLPLLPEASREWLGRGDAGKGGGSSAPSAAAFSDLSAWPQTVAEAKRRLKAFASSTAAGTAEDEAAGTEPPQGEVGEGAMPVAQQLAAAAPDFVHPFWFNPTQLASCPQASFSLEGAAGVRKPVPFTCGLASLRGVKKGVAHLTASLQQQGLHASSRLDVYLPIELWLLSGAPAFPPPGPSKLANGKVAPLLQRLTEPARIGGAGSNTGGGNAAGAPPRAATALEIHQLDLQPSYASRGDQSVGEEKALFHYGFPAASLGSSSSGLGVQGEVALIVGGSISVFMKEGPPARPEAYRYSRRAAAETAPPGAATAADKDEEADAAVVAVLPAEAAGGLTRVVCLHPGRLPVIVRFQAVYEPKYPSINSSRAEAASLLVYCGFPELLEVRVLPSLSQRLPPEYSSFSSTQKADAGETLLPLALLTQQASGRGAPVPAATLAATKTAPLSGAGWGGWETGADGGPAAAEGLFVQCGALHVFGLFAYDAKLRPLAGLSALPARWSLSPSYLPPQQRQQQQDTRLLEQRPLLQLLPGPTAAGGAEETLPGSAGSVAALAVSASTCCGSYVLRVSVSVPTGAPSALKPALAPQQTAQLEASLKLWSQIASQQQSQRAQLSLWREGRLEDGLLLLLSPPLRLLPSPPLGYPAAATTGEGRLRDHQAQHTVRLFNHPGHYQRLLLQFGSPHVECIRLLAAPHPTSGAAGGPLGRPLLHGELVLMGSGSASLKCLSPLQAAARYEQLLKAESAETTPAAVAAATATDVACLSLPGASENVASVALHSPFSYPSSPFSSSCPLSVRELFVSPPPLLPAAAAAALPVHQQQQDEEQHVILTLEAVDPWLLSPWRPPVAAFVDGGGSSRDSTSSRNNGPQLVARLQFVRLKSLRLVLLPTPVTAVSFEGGSPGAAARASANGLDGEKSVLPPLCDLREETAGGAAAAGGAQPPHQSRTAVAHIEGGKIFALRVQALGEDGLPLDSTFFAAMKLSLVALPADDSSSSSNVGITRGQVYLKAARSQKHRDYHPHRQQQQQQGPHLPEALSALLSPRSAGSPLAAASYDPAAAVAAERDFAAPEEWDQLSTDLGDAADCAHFFVAASDMRGSFVLHAEAYTAAAPGSSSAAGPAAAALGEAGVVAVTTRLTVEIHPPLELTPSHLVMLPGGHSFELTLQGGPDDAQTDSTSGGRRDNKYERRFSVDDRRVARLSTAFPGLLLTGEEGETRVSASLQRGGVGGRLTQAAMRVVVALPRAAAIVSGSALQSSSSSSRSNIALSERQAREAQQAALLPTQASRLGYGRAAATAAAAAAAAASAGGERVIEVYANHAVPLQGALFDGAGRRFSHPHLLLPTGPLGGDGDGRHEEAARRQAMYGALGSLPPSDAVACVFDWEVRSSFGVPSALLLSPMDVPLAEPAVQRAAAAAAALQDEAEDGGRETRGSPAEQGRTRLRSRGLAGVLLVGVEAGETRLSLSVSCFRRNREVAVVTAAEVSVRVLVSAAHAALAPAASPGLTGIVSSLTPFAAPVLPPLLAADGVYLLPCCTVALLELEASPTSAAAAEGVDVVVRPEQVSRDACCAAAAAKAKAAREGDEALAAAEAATAAAACCEAVEGSDCCDWSSAAAAGAAAAKSAVFVLSGSKGFIASPVAGLQGVVRLSAGAGEGQQQQQQLGHREAGESAPPLHATLGSGSTEHDERGSRLLVGVETALVDSIQLFPLMHVLELGASRDVQVGLRDARGRLLVSPSSLKLKVSSSHPSVVSVAVVSGPEGPLGPPAARLRANQRGCASVSVTLLSPAPNLYASRQQEQQQQHLHLLTSSLRVCSDSAEALLSAPPPAVLPGASLSLLGGARMPPPLLPARAALNVQIAFRASAMFAALSAWNGGPPHEAAEGGRAAAAAAPAAAEGSVPCMSQEAAAALLPRVSPQLRVEIQRLVGTALQRLPAGTSHALEPSFLPRVAIRSLAAQQLQPDDAVSAVAAREGGAGSLCSLHAAGGAGDDATLVIADVQILDLPAAAAAAVSQHSAGDKQEAAAAAAAGTLDSIPEEWRLDGIQLLLQQLWRGLEREWGAALPAAASLLEGCSSSRAASLCSRRCPGWSFPLASFISWDRGFGVVSLSTSSSTGSRSSNRRSGKSRSHCKELGGVRSSDPSSLTLIGSGSCNVDNKGFGLVAVAARESERVHLLQHGASLAALEILPPAAVSAAAGPRRFRLLASAVCDESQQQQVQQQHHEDEQWVAVEELSLPRCRAAGGSLRGSLSIGFRAEALQLPAASLSLAGGERLVREEAQASWQEVPFVTPLFNSHLSISCRLVDPLLSRLFSVTPATVPSTRRDGGGRGGAALSEAEEETEQGGRVALAGRPLCTLTEKPRVTIQEILPYLQSDLAASQTIRTEELLWGLPQGGPPSYTSGDCEGLVEALKKPAATSLSLVITLSHTTSALALLHQQQQQQLRQQLLLPQRELFWGHCMQWHGAVSPRLLYDKATMTDFAAPDAPSSAPAATVSIRPAKQILRFTAPSSSSSSSKSRLLVALPTSSSSSSSKWPLELHVFPILSAGTPAVRLSSEAFAVSTERQGPLLTLRIIPSLKASTTSAVEAAAAGGERGGILLEWTAPEHTELVVEVEAAGAASGWWRLRVVLEGLSGRSRGSAEPLVEEVTFTETAAPPLLVCTLFVCLGALTCWLYLRSTGTAGSAASSEFAAAGEEAGGSQAALKSSDAGTGGEGGPYLTRSGRAAAEGVEPARRQPRRYDAPFTPVRQSGTEPPSYTLQPNGAWQVSAPLAAGGRAPSFAPADNNKASTRFYAD